jgi:hypothetical protein
MCDLVGKLQSADNLRLSAGLSTCYRPCAEFLEQHMKPNRAFHGLVPRAHPPHVSCSIVESRRKIFGFAPNGV